MPTSPLRWSVVRRIFFLFCKHVNALNLNFPQLLNIGLFLALQLEIQPHVDAEFSSMNQKLKEFKDKHFLVIEVEIFMTQLDTILRLHLTNDGLFSFYDPLLSEVNVSEQFVSEGSLYIFRWYVGDTSINSNTCRNITL